MIHFQIHEAIATLSDGSKIGIVGDQEMNIPNHQGERANLYYEGLLLPESGKVNADCCDLAVVLIQNVPDWINALKVALKAAKTVLIVSAKPGHFPKWQGVRFDESDFKELGELLGVNVMGTFTRAAYHNHDTGQQTYAIYTRTDAVKFPTKKKLNEVFAK